MKAFGTITHHYAQLTTIDETFETIETPLGMKLPLLQHQKSIVAAMLSLESTQYLRVMAKSTMTYFSSNALMLVEPFGSGKTIEILALVLASPIPYAFPETRHMGDYIATRYSKQAMLKPTLIIVNSSVANQWKEAAIKFTCLDVVVVDSNRALQTLAKTMPNPPYDVIVVKSGVISGDLPGIDHEVRRHSIEAIRSLSAGRLWARIVYDDFDTLINIVNVEPLDALSSIYVSATVSSQRKSIKYNTILSIPNMYLDYLLCNVYCVSCSNEYRQLSYEIPKAYFYRYVYVSKDAPYIHMMKAMDMDNILEMLCGGAVITAADTLGIKSTSTADLFERILEKKYKKYLYYSQSLAGATQALDVYNTTYNRPSHELEPEELSHVIWQVKRGDACPYALSDGTLLDWYPTEFKKRLLQVKQNAKDKKEIEGTMLDRIMGNAREGYCQVCNEPLENTNVIINKCCGVVVCDYCGVKGNKLTPRRNTLEGTCVHCLKSITHADLLVVDGSVSLASIVESSATLSRGRSEEAPVSLHMEASPKLRALECIINGSVPEGRDPYNIAISNLVTGATYVPDESTPKVLIFANYNEILDIISTHLTSKNILFEKINGTAANMHRQITAFTTGTFRVLLINSNVRCAGMNLECATDVVFYHRLLDPAIEAQVIGRAQRIGRKASVRVHYLLFENE